MNIKQYAGRLLLVAFILSLAVNSTVSLILYIGGDAILSSYGSVVAITGATFVGGLIMGTIVHFFIMAVASVMGVVLMGLLRGFMKSSDNVGTPTPTAGGDDAFKGFLKKFVIGVALVALLLAGYQSLLVYGLLSAVSGASGLIALATGMTFAVSLVYASAVCSFIGIIGTIVIGAMLGLLGGSRKAS